MSQTINLDTGEVEEIRAQPPAIITDREPVIDTIDLETGDAVERDIEPLADPVTPQREPDDGRTALGRAITEHAPFLEPVLQIGSSMIAEPVAGVEGAIRAPFEGAEAASQQIEKRRNQLTFDTQSPGGQQMLRLLGGLVEQGVEIASLPIEGLQGIAAWIATQDPEEAARQIDEMKQKGVGAYLGDELFRTTGSETAAAAGRTLPTMLASLFGFKKAPNVTPGVVSGARNVIETANKAGVDVLSSDIKPPSTPMGRLAQGLAERVPVVGTGGVRAKQRQQRIDAINAIEDATPEIQHADIFDSLQRTANKRRNAAGQRIEDVRNTISTIEQRGSSPVLPGGSGSVSPISDSVRQLVLDGPGSFGKGDDALATAIRNLQKPGRIKDQSLIGHLEELQLELIDAGQDFAALREFRTTFRQKVVEKTDPTGKSQLATYEKSQMNQVLAGITDDLDNYVKGVLGQDAFRKYKAADKIYADEAAVLTKSRLKTTLDRGDVKPELVENLLFSSSKSEVDLLWRNLNQAGRDHARHALMGRALKNATFKGEVSPERFLTQLDRLEDNFGIFFRGEKKREIEGLRKLLQVTRRADAAGVVTPTGQQLVAPLLAMMGGAAFYNPAAKAAFASVLTVGGVGRLYETSLVRNRIIRAAEASDKDVLEIARELPVLFEAAMPPQPEEEQAP